MVKNISGFTLIELLVVITVLGILAAGVLTAIDPLQRIRQAKDTKVRNDFGQIVQALQAYSVTNQGLYPVATDYTALGTLLEGSNDLKKMPSFTAADYTYVFRGTAASAIIYTTLLAPKDKTKPVYCWDTTNSVFIETTARDVTATTCQ